MQAKTIMSSDYLAKDRALLEAVYRACKKYDISYNTLSDDWVITLEKNGLKRFIYGNIFDYNAQSPAEIATDKVATSQLLAQSGIAAVPHYLLTTVDKPKVDPVAVEELLKQYQSLVIKPLFGRCGQLVARFDTAQDIISHIEGTDTVAWAASPFIDIQREVRLVVLDDSIELAYEKKNPVQVDGLRMFNLNLGATPESMSVANIGEDAQSLAIQSTQSIGLKLGAVDVIFDAQGTAYVLEINSNFGLAHFALTSPENRAQVIDFYIQVIEHLFGL
jgi:glutathione synthase/RimK-type ligase-like ATP-grasp enzyme